MKKTLCALAVLGAFAGTSLAADVTLYGIVDEGLLYTNIDKDGKADAVDKLELKSGIQGSSRFGFKGVEEIGNGLKVGFILENGFTADDGALSGGTTLFDRESSLFIEGGFGKLAFGKIGAITQGTSSWGKLGTISAFGTGFGDYTTQAGASFAKGAVMNNVIAYQTPSFGGVQVYAQYGMGEGATATTENTSKANRYYALGAIYSGGPVALYAAVDSNNYQTAGLADRTTIEDSLAVTLGGSYDFGVTKVHLGVQYFDEVKLSSVGSLKALLPEDGAATMDPLKGYAVSISNKTPVLGGSLMFGVSYIDAETADSFSDLSANIKDGRLGYDVKRIGASAAYTYNLSKRTSTYALVGYWRDSYDFKAADKTDVDPSSVAVAVGIRTNF